MYIIVNILFSLINYLIGILKELFDTAIKFMIAFLFLLLLDIIKYYIKRNRGMLRWVITPYMRVLKSGIVNIENYKIEEMDNNNVRAFKSMFESEEQEKLLIHSRSKQLFNGDMIRLCAIENNIIYVQKIKYYDFLTTNLVLFPSNAKLLTPKDSIWHFLYDKEFRECVALENKFKASISWYGKLDSFNSVIKVNKLANAIAISVLISDRNDNLIIAKRGEKNAISSGNYAVTSTGSLDIIDLNSENPFIEAGKREVKEELGFTDIELVIREIIIVKQKLQPVVLMDGRINSEFDEYVTSINCSRDYYNENKSLYLIPREKILGIVKGYRFSDTSIYQLVGNISTKKWLLTLPKNINKYKVDVWR